MDRKIQIRRYSNEAQTAWNNFIKSAKNSLFMFDRNYMEYHSDRFEDCSLLFYDEDELVAVFPANLHHNILVSHGGLTYGGMITGNGMRQAVMLDCFSAILKYCEDRDIEKIQYKTVPSIYHKQPAEEDTYALYYFGGVIDKIEASTVINLDNPLRITRLRKRRINKALKSDIVIGPDNSQDAYIRFMEVQNRVLNEYHGVNAVHTGEEMYLLYSRFPENIQLYTARLNGEILGGSIIFIYDNVLHTQYLCANEKARDMGALDAVIAYVIDIYKGQKRWLDFGISTEHSGHYLNEGLISQKEGFGGRTNVYRTWSINIGGDRK